MGNKIRISPIWTFSVIAAIICAVFIAFFYLQMPAKEVRLEKYRQAKICQNAPACRQTQTATILESNTQGSKIKVPGRFSSHTLTNTEYYFKIDLGNNQRQFYITTNVSAEGNLFDVPNIYIPEKSETNFAEINFPKGKQIDLELWEGQVTLIFVDLIGQHWSWAPGNNIFFMTPIPPSNFRQNDGTLEKQKTSLQFAVPTVDHPLIALKQAYKDFLYSILAVMIILPLTIFLMRHFTKK